MASQEELNERLFRKAYQRLVYDVRLCIAWGADVAWAINCLRGEEDADKALATLFAAGAYPTEADAIEECCRAALEGLAKPGNDETTVLTAALDKLRGQ